MRGVHEHYGRFSAFFRSPRVFPAASIRQSLVLALLPLVVLSLAVATLAAATPFGPWQSPLLRQHPLVGRIFDTANGAEISRDELIARLTRHDIALLGEVHDNPDHHRIQAQLLREFAAAARRRHGKPPAVVFEMIPHTYQRRLDLILKLPEVDADMVFDAVRWESLGWPDRRLYRPIVETALQAGAPLIAAGVPRKTVRRVAREGFSVLRRRELRVLKLAPLPPAQQAALEREIVKSHCNMISADMAQRMSEVQRLRDARLAAGVRAGFMRQGSAVLITGDGHVRKDRAVPLYLRRHGMLPAPFVLWQAEAKEEAKILAHLLPDDTRPENLADAVIVTPRAVRPDPCERFRKFMKKKGQD